MIAPLIILLIAVLVGYVTALTGESLRANAKNALAYDTQAALDNIETTAATAIHFCGTYTFSPSSTDTLALAGGTMFNRSGELVCTVRQEMYFPPPRR